MFKFSDKNKNDTMCFSHRSVANRVFTAVEFPGKIFIWLDVK